MLAEVEGVSNLVDDGRHGDQGSGWRGGRRGWSCWRGWAEAGCVAALCLRVA